MYHLGPSGTALKVHFAAAGGSIVGAVYADGLECSSEGIVFYLGACRVAFLTSERLCIDERTIKRESLDQSRPFSFEWAGGPDPSLPRRRVK